MDEHGYGYSTKLIKCPSCGRFIAAEYIEDKWLRESAAEFLPQSDIIERELLRRVIERND